MPFYGAVSAPRNQELCRRSSPPAKRFIRTSPPAEADLQWHFHVTPTVHQMVLTLEGAGFIKRKQGVARSIELDPENLPVLR